MKVQRRLNHILQVPLLRNPKNLLLKGLKLRHWCARQIREYRLKRRALRRMERTRGLQPNSRMAVLVTDRIGSRVCKIGLGLKSIGWRVVLLYRDGNLVAPERYFDEMVQYASPAEALLIATRFAPIVYHVFSNWNFDVAELFIKHKPGKIVFDDYDVLGGTLLPHVADASRRQIDKERFCLEDSDGLCCRDLETQSVKRAGYRFRGLRILFPDYCWGHASLLPVANDLLLDFHIVNCGNIPVSTEHEVLLHKKELTALARKLVALGLRAHRIHFHIYPTGSIWRSAAGSTPAENGLEGTELWFHLHGWVQPDELPSRLAQYDAGLYTFTLSMDPPTYNDFKFTYTSGNRVFDYLDAGLPVIIHGSEFMEYLMRHAGVDIRMEAELTVEARRYLEGQDQSSLRRNAAQASSRLAVTNHASRLAAFYEAL